jgi:hypothetical protein
MGILVSVKARNFKCFRDLRRIDLTQGTYLVGPNNAGKTAILQAIGCFFDSSNYSPTFLNRTEFNRRQTGFNRSDITLTFDLNLVTGRVRHDRMIANYGNHLAITKTFTWREQSNSVIIDYLVNDETFVFENLNDDIKHLLNSIAISYIHPQEGAELLRKAQEKFKKRLFHNWGRHSSVSDRLASVQQNWDELRQTANAYLSGTLTDRLREIWPTSDVKIDLPNRLEDIVAISEIAFRSAPNLPEISLTSQGTGAQSTILYQTHYVLDSDRSLHQGMYFPIWLLEEPESFLHADIAFQLGRLLASSEWQSNIQMVISTHSPIILAGSRHDPSTKKWVLIDRYETQIDRTVDAVTETDIAEIGRAMGDSNFEVYFAAASQERLILIEDSRNLTRTSFENAGVPVTKSLNGISEVKKYLGVYLGVTEAVSANTYFIVDGDKGLSELASILASGEVIANLSGWKKYKMGSRIFVAVLPEGSAVEDLFEEWPEVLNETIDDLLNENLSIKDSIPTRLSRVIDPIRRNPPADRAEAISRIRPLQDVKDRFWQRVSESDWRIADQHAAILRELISD